MVLTKEKEFRAAFTSEKWGDFQQAPFSMQKTGIVKPTPGREIMFLKTY
jgi:hypothetical protein